MRIPSMKAGRLHLSVHLTDGASAVIPRHEAFRVQQASLHRIIKKIRKQSPNKLGNACHAISSASTLAYTAATFFFAKPGSKLFDDEWVQHGFCVIQQDIPYWNTHDLCLYFDVILVALGLLVYRSLRGVPTPEMKYADEMMLFNMLGHLGHGIAHGFIGATFRSGSDGMGAQNNTGMERLAMEEDHMKNVKHVFIGVGFWIGLPTGGWCTKPRLERWPFRRSLFILGDCLLVTCLDLHTSRQLLLLHLRRHNSRV
mmetsp:Transcript_14240/g.25726  ORF Transcript_14240/g.25726 Transcript_14240/m.25726 type:complete len:256 (+) Transcript_14240:507-1274(+)